MLDFRPVIGNRRALAYILAYGAHCWELFTLRSWLVAFLALGAAREPAGLAAVMSPTAVATLSGLFAVGASIGGNELALRFGRRRTIRRTALVSAAMAAGIGFTARLSYAVVVVLVLALHRCCSARFCISDGGRYGGCDARAQWSDVGACTPLFGFGCAGIGPVVFGAVLDARRGRRCCLLLGRRFRLRRRSSPSSWRRHSRSPAAVMQSTAAGPRVSGAMDVEQTRSVDLGVSLCRRQRSMSEQFLYRPEVTAAGEQVGREAVAKRMRRRRLRQA